MAKFLLDADKDNWRILFACFQEACKANGLQASKTASILIVTKFMDLAKKAKVLTEVDEKAEEGEEGI